MCRVESGWKTQLGSVWSAGSNTLCIVPSPPCLTVMCAHLNTQTLTGTDFFYFSYRLNGVAVGVGVVQAGNDFEQLESGIERVEQNLGKIPQQVVTDGGFVSRDNIVAMKERGVEFIGPCVDEVGKGQSSYEGRGVSPEYHSSQFIYDAPSDSYRCPQGKLLSYEGKEERHMQMSYRYRARRSDCQACPVRSQCCPGNRVVGRSVHRSEELAEVTEFRQKMQSERAREIYRQRAQVA